MNLVNLVSGGLDSTLITVMAKEEGVTKVFPLFVDYGQRAAEREWRVCQHVYQELNLPSPVKMNLSGFGQVIRSGLTSEDLDVKDDAFTPGRNLLFLLMGSAYAYQVGASTISIGLLSEEFSLFPDQRLDFVKQAEKTIEVALNRNITITTPLSDFSKADVINLAKKKGISGTYSCHSGTEQPCGYCISCLEFSLETKE